MTTGCLFVRSMAYLKLHSSLKKAFEAFRQLKVSFKKTESHWAGKTLRILFRKKRCSVKTLFSKWVMRRRSLRQKIWGWPKFSTDQNRRRLKWKLITHDMRREALEDGRKIVWSKRSNVSHHHRRHQEIILKTAWKVFQRPQIQATDPWKSINDGSSK